MKICLVTDEFQGITGGGGIGACFAGLSEILARQGHKIDVLITSNKNLTPEGERALSQSHLKGIRVFLLKNIRSESLSSNIHRDNIVISYEVFQFISSNIYDVVHFHEYLGLGFYTSMARREGLLESTFVITQTHGSTSWVRRHNMTLPDLHTLEVEEMERKQIEFSDMVVSPSQYMLDWYISEKVKLPETRVINWVLPAWNDFSNPDVTLVTRQLESKNLKNIIFFGRHERRKGIEIFVNALQMLPDHLDINVTFLGRFDMIDRENSVSYILRKIPKFSGRLSFYGDYDQVSAHRYMQRQKDAVCVMPSLIENSPCTVGESLTNRLPFIATNVGGTRHLIDKESQNTALIAPNSKDLAKKILDIYENGLKPIKASLVPGKIFNDWDKLHDYITKKEYPVVNNLSNPLVSVVLTHYERPVLVRRALNHIVNQTYKNIEVILVDDGSPSSITQEALNEIERDFDNISLKIIRSSNKYLGAARNIGVQHSSGTYIKFQDDDNISEPNEIEVFVKAALNSKFDVLTAQSYIFHDQDKPELGKIEYFPIGIGGDFSFFRNRFGDANALISRKVFDQIGGFSEHYGVGWEDWEFFLKCYCAGITIGLVPIPLFRYYASGTGMLASGMPRLNNNRIFDAVRQFRPTLNADLIQYMRREEIGQQIIDKTWWTLAKESNSETHHQLTALEPNSDEAVVLLVDLAFALGRIDDAVALGLTRNASRKEVGRLIAISALNQNKRTHLQYRVGHCQLDIATDLKVYVARGWSASANMQPLTFEGMIIEDKYFKVAHKNDILRPDVHSSYNSIGSPFVGFELILIECYGKMLNNILNAYKEVKIQEISTSKYQTFLVSDVNVEACIGWIEEFKELNISAIALPVINNSLQDGKLEVAMSNNSSSKLIIIQGEGHNLMEFEDGRFEVGLDNIQDINSERLAYIVSENKENITEALIFTRE